MDLLLDDIVSGYKNKILDMIERLQNKIVVFDIDGNICKFKYTENDTNALLPCKDDELKDFLYEYDMYQNAIPLKTMQFVISNLEIQNVYTLSTATKPAEGLKDKWLAVHYPMILKENIIYVPKDILKIDRLKEIINKHQGIGIVFLEDTAKTLLNVEEALPEVELIHLSHFIS